MERTETIAFTVTDEEKKRFRQIASSRGLSMAELARQESLAVLTEDENVTVPEIREESGHEIPPLEDFIAAHLTVSEDADPVPKATVYKWYQSFCERVYPDHEIETQHKVSREVGKIADVKTGRRYLQDSPSGSDTRTRCFLNVKRISNGQNESRPADPLP